MKTRILNQDTNRYGLEMNLGDIVEITYNARSTSYGVFGIDPPVTSEFNRTQVGYVRSLSDHSMEISSAKGAYYKVEIVSLSDIVRGRVVERAR